MSETENEHDIEGEVPWRPWRAPAPLDLDGENQGETEDSGPALWTSRYAPPRPGWPAWSGGTSPTGTWSVERGNGEAWVITELSDSPRTAVVALQGPRGQWTAPVCVIRGVVCRTPDDVTERVRVLLGRTTGLGPKRFAPRYARVAALASAVLESAIVEHEASGWTVEPPASEAARLRRPAPRPWSVGVRDDVFVSERIESEGALAEAIEQLIDSGFAERPRQDL